MAKPVRRVAVFATFHTPRAVTTARRLVSWLERRGVAVRLREDTAARLARPDLGVEEGEVARQAGLVLALGGDGTLLGAARAAWHHNAPVLGVHLGGFGYLSEIAGKDLMARLPRILDGEFRAQRRIMVQADIVRKGRKRETLIGLNDVAVTTGAFSRLVRFRARVAGDHLGDLPADGIIIATPTGSTGYCLAAGGPIVGPQIEALVVVPICPHTLSARPLVVSAKHRIEIEVPPLGRSQEVMATVDGQVGRALQSGDVVRVTQAPRRVRLVALGDSFYERLRTKLRWGVHA